MYGLSDKLQIKEAIVKVDEKTAKRYRVVEETIDLDKLRQEKANLEADLNMAEPKDEELVELGRASHPFYFQDREYLERRIAQIDSLLATVSQSQ